MNEIVGPVLRSSVDLESRLRELGSLASIVVGAAALRLANLPVRGGWDSDQGTEMLTLRAAVNAGQLPTLDPQAGWVGGVFHHGALSCDRFTRSRWQWV